MIHTSTEFKQCMNCILVSTLNDLHTNQEKTFKDDLCAAFVIIYAEFVPLMATQRKR